MKHTTFIEYLTEAQVHRSDPEMDEYYDKQGADPRNTREGPYAVGWHGQYMEWYGSDEGPQSGEGRYKMKGDGGRLVAINVPSYTQAMDIQQTLDDRYEDGQFEDELVYHEYGKDWGVTQYQGAYIIPMSKLEDYELELYGRKAKDYSKAT